jgi:hypothetical protein
VQLNAPVQGKQNLLKQQSCQLYSQNITIPYYTKSNGQLYRENFTTEKTLETTASSIAQKLSTTLKTTASSIVQELSTTLKPTVNSTVKNSPPLLKQLPVLQ